MMIPKSQNATSTDGSAPRKILQHQALYAAHDEPGEPGRGRRPVEDGERVMIALSCVRGSNAVSRG